MKFSFPIFAAALLMMAVSCKSVDKEFLSKINSDLSTMEAVGGQLNDLGSQLAGLKNTIDGADETIKANAGYGALVGQLTSVITKQGSMSTMLNDMIGQVKTMATDYAAGKLKTDAVKSQFETVTNSFGAMQGEMTGLSSSISEITTAWGALQSAAAAAAPTK